MARAANHQAWCWLKSFKQQRCLASERKFGSKFAHVEHSGFFTRREKTLSQMHNKRIQFPVTKRSDRLTVRLHKKLGANLPGSAYFSNYDPDLAALEHLSNHLRY